MLKYIQLHIDADEDAQRAMEEKISPEIQRLNRENVNAFQRYMPSVYEYIKAPAEVASSVLCNKFGELNIVDYQTGRVVYGFHPRQEVDAQVVKFLDSAQPVTVDTDRTVNHNVKRHIPVLVVLGIGLGYHLEQLLNTVTVEHLIIYEPNLAYFLCSLSAVSWKEILVNAQASSTAIYLQLDCDGRTLGEDIQELSQHVGVSSFYLYRHYNYPVFNQLEAVLKHRSWDEFRRWRPDPKAYTSSDDYLPPWTESLPDAQWQAQYLDTSLLQANIAAFELFFPDIAAEFRDYQPTKWAPKANQQGIVNLFHLASEQPFYGEKPAEDCATSFDYFSSQPNKDGLVLGYKGKKLKKYLHYQLVTKASEILDGIEEAYGELPEKIKSVIFFGLGVGYQLNELFRYREVEKLFICEPNRDFFFASLYAVDWKSILESIDRGKGRLYINIGDDGSHLIRDLLTQFHSVGPYVLASTYFYQGYYNASLVNAVAELREQLQVIIAMGDYFDHSKYGIAHTRWGVEHGIPLLKRNSHKLLNSEQKDVPVFVIGNGPSLDGLIDIIKQHRDSAILISCGTSLQTLHRHGICPDFHAEIETNRSTFDWAVRVGDLAYLKQITLISCNGIHPDTCGLYKDVFLAFKEGESSTVSITEIFPEHEFALLRFAYPTVTNFAVNFTQELGFSQLYLIGVDMGFVDARYHHSKSSGYYTQEGVERYNYQEDNDTSIVVEGNLRPFVKTKFEFKVSKTVLEQTFSPKADVYNLNDGARIAGASPLHKDDVFIVADESAKQDSLTQLKSRCFRLLPTDDASRRFSQRYQHKALIEEVQRLVKMAAKNPDNKQDAEAFIEIQRDILVASFRRQKSLLFFYLNGTLNFINSALMKTLSLSEEAACMSAFNQLLSLWRTSLDEIVTTLTFDEGGFDYISSFEMERRRLYMRMLYQQYPRSFAIKPLLPEYVQPLEEAMTVLGIQQCIAKADTADFVVNWYVVDDSENGVTISTKPEQLLAHIQSDSHSRLLYLPGDIHKPEDSPVCQHIQRSFLAVIAVTGCAQFCLYLPKLILTHEDEVERYYPLSEVAGLHAYDCGNFIAFSRELIHVDDMLFDDGTRARFIARQLTKNDFIQLMVSESEIEQIKHYRINKFNSLAVNHDNL